MANRRSMHMMALIVGASGATGRLRYNNYLSAVNEQAAEYLRSRLGQDGQPIKWSAVRTESQLDEPQMSDYTVHVSPIRSAILDGGAARRIHVSHAMAELLANEHSGSQWQAKMLVIYNRELTASISPT